MKAKLLTFALLLVSLSSGCTHFGNVSRVETPEGDKGEVFVSSRMDRAGAVREEVREHVVEVDGRCSEVRLRRDIFDAAGKLERTVVEHRRCGLVELRRVDRYDVASATHVQEISVDSDRDGLLDEHAVRVVPTRTRGTLAARNASN